VLYRDIEYCIGYRGSTMKKTLYCINCGIPASTWEGHVHRWGEELFAGWCEECSMVPPGLRAQPALCTILQVGGGRTCYGKWLEKYGIVGIPQEKYTGGETVSPIVDNTEKGPEVGTGESYSPD
jgi:hypothetical protein